MRELRSAPHEDRARANLLLVASVGVILSSCGGAQTGATQEGQEGRPAAVSGAWLVDDRSLELEYTGGACDTAARAEAREEARTVHVRVTVDEAEGDCEDVGIVRRAGVTLSAALDGRAIVDETTGERVELDRGAG